MNSHMRRLPAERARHAKRRPSAQLNNPTAWENPGSNPALLFPLGSSADDTNNNVDAAEPVPPLLPLPTTTAQTTTKAAVTSSVKPVTPPSSTSPAVPSNTTTVASVKSIPTTSTTATSTSATSTTSSSASSSSTPVVTSTPPPPSTSQAPLTSMVVVVPTTSPTVTADPDNDATSSASKKGLSGGAIGGIVALAIIGVLAITVFFVRKRYLRRRERRRNTWGAGVFPNPSDFDKDRDYSSPINEKPLPVSPAAPLSPFDIHGTSVYTAAAAPPPMQSQMMHSPASYTTFPPPPPASYNNPIMPNAFGAPVPSMLTPSATAVVGMARAAAGGSPQSASPPMTRMPSLSRNETTVKCSFIPSLPDELSISTGERVAVSARYDDGWALCVNGRGEQGMVPQECLEDTDKTQSPIDPPQYQDAGDWRNAKRKSSLAPAGDRMY